MFWSLIGFSAHDFAYKVVCVVGAQAPSILHLAHVCMFFRVLKAVCLFADSACARSRGFDAFFFGLCLLLKTAFF